jgi:hypothetical protein
MKKSHMNKIFALSAVTSCLLISTSIFAGGPVPSPAELAAVAQLKALNTNVQVVGNRMQAIAEANAKSQNSTVPDESILSSMLANPAVAQNKDANDTNITTLTENDIASQLNATPYNLVQTGNGLINSSQIQSTLQAASSQTANLTQGVVASDSIFSNDPSVLSLVPSYTQMGLIPKRGLAQPKAAELQDNFFDFGSILQPMVYQTGTNQELAAQTYLQYLTKSYNKPSDALKLDDFNKKLAQTKDGSDKISLYSQLLNDPNYRDYQLSVRSDTATRSVAINNFEKMIAERTPIKNLGKLAGLKDKDGKSIDDASPLQVQSYLANRRVDNPKWYAHVQSATQQNVARETLVVLAEIESQNFQAHMDRERLLATISAQSAATSTLTAQMLAAKAQNVNEDIAKLKIPSVEKDQEEQQQKQQKEQEQQQKKQQGRTQ